MCLCVCVCVCVCVCTHFFFTARHPLVDQGLLIFEDSRLPSDTPHSVGLLWTSDQPDAETFTWQNTTLTRDRHPFPRRDSNPKSQQSRGCRPPSYTVRPLGLAYVCKYKCILHWLNFVFNKRTSNLENNTWLCIQFKTHREESLKIRRRKSQPKPRHKILVYFSTCSAALERFVNFLRISYGDNNQTVKRSTCVPSTDNECVFELHVKKYILHNDNRDYLCLSEHREIRARLGNAKGTTFTSFYQNINIHV